MKPHWKIFNPTTSLEQIGVSLNANFHKIFVQKFPVNSQTFQIINHDPLLVISHFYLSKRLIGVGKVLSQHFLAPNLEPPTRIPATYDMNRKVIETCYLKNAIRYASVTHNDIFDVSARCVYATRDSCALHAFSIMQNSL